MDRYICIHGHFYQPPRENPWLDAVEVQDSAHPYHDWNERITAECYAPNRASRTLNGRGRIANIVSNYSQISFNFGPTLLSWMEKNSRDTYEAILAADRESMSIYSGHGNALAQAYNHLIMPLANRRDKRTQVLWGIRDFEHRFKRRPEGMWLSETAVDLETLELLADSGIKFTILAPHQASKVRKIGTSNWRDVSGGAIDPTTPYLLKLSSGRSICIFFYDGPISRAVAFERLLYRGEGFASRLVSGFSNHRDWPQLLHIATDGETYGHHHKFGDMALAYALDYIKTNKLAKLTNYGEYLEKYPPDNEAQIYENSSWSCMHGIERWRSNCGCNSGGKPHWDQEWRGPLRDALDWLRDQLAMVFEREAGRYFGDPWKARDDYIDVVLDRSEDGIAGFFERNTSRELSEAEKTTVLKLLEIQRHSMLMYTSCGWFFDELSGIETVQVIQYAGRAIQLSRELFDDNLESHFLIRLGMAKSNMPNLGNGAVIYEKFVKSSMIDLKKVAAHFAISSLFTDYIDETEIFSYSVEREDFERIEAGRMTLSMGRIKVRSGVTLESEILTFCVLHMGNHSLNGGVRTFLGMERYLAMKEEVKEAFEKGSFAEIVRLMDKHFGMHSYSIPDLFRDEQRKILSIMIRETTDDLEKIYRQIFDNNRLLMSFLSETGMPIPRGFAAAAELILNSDLRKALSNGMEMDQIQSLINDISRWGLRIDEVDVEFTARHSFESIFEKVPENPSDLSLLLRAEKVAETLKLLPLEMNYWHIQNIYFDMLKKEYLENRSKAATGDKEAGQWVATFKYIGELLHFDVLSVLPAEQ